MRVKIKVGVSSCLLGERVRYDGGHRRSACVTEMLARYFEFVPFCPEMAIGLGVPRPPIQLVAIGREIRARGVQDPAVDVTDALAEYAGTVVAQLVDVGGCILKKRSPSCGISGVEIFTTDGKTIATGSGIFTRTLLDLRPELPVIEEDVLEHHGQREEFIERVFAYHHQQ